MFVGLLLVGIAILEITMQKLKLSPIIEDKNAS